MAGVICEYLASPPVFGEPLLLIYLVFCAFYVLFVFVLGTVCSTLPVSLNFSFFIAALVFSNVYIGPYRNLQLLNHVIIINTKVPLYQAHATLTEFGYPVYVIVLSCSRRLLNYFAFKYLGLSLSE